MRFSAPGSSRVTLRFILVTSCVELTQFESAEMAENSLLAEQCDLSLSIGRKARLSRGVTSGDVASGDLLITWISYK